MTEVMPPSQTTESTQISRVAWLHFANDFTLDFISPLLPAGVGVAWLGIMEGAADAIGQVLKLVTGRASDRSGRRVPWVAAGYSINAVARPLIGIGLLLVWPWWIIACRIIDRVGKGVRGSAVDAFIADWTDDGSRARAFARMRIMDHLGATLGGLAAAAVTFWFEAQLGWVVCGLVLVTLLVAWLCRGLRDAPRMPAAEGKPLIPAGWWPSSPVVQRPLAAIGCAALAAKVSPLLILAYVAGMSGAPGAAAWPLWQVCLGWAVLGVIQAAAAGVAGLLTERLGPTRLLQGAWLIHAGVFVALAFTSGWGLLATGVAFGICAGLTEGAEKTWLATLAPRAERAVTFGALAFITAGAVLAGNAVCGGLLAWWGPLVFLGLAAALIIGVLGTLGSKPTT